MYSALDGFSTTDEIADRISFLGMPGAFLTDHGTVAGFRPFEKSMRAKGLFCGFGMEAYQTFLESRSQRPEDRKKRDQAHLILLAKNDEGLANLMRLSDEANRTGYFYAPRVDWELLEKYKEGIICTSACMGGRVARGVWNDDNRDLHRYREIFRDDFYVELHTYDSEEQKALNLELQSLCLDLSIPVLVANDAHYLTKDEHSIHEIMLAMQYKKAYDPNKHVHPPSLYIMSEQDVLDALMYLKEEVVDEAIANTEEIMDKCNASLPEFRLHLPKFKTEKITSEQLLRNLLIEGLKEKYEELTDEIIDRAEYEYSAIAAAGLADYFLIVRDFINWAKHRGILVGPGRGSVGGSIMAYCLGITNIDPLKFGLYFERFWNPGRAKGLPDIDVDFQDDRRDEVKDYLASIYGDEAVIRIGNHTTFRPINAIEDVGRSLQIPYGDIERIKKILKQGIDAGQQADWDEMSDEIVAQLDRWEEQYPLLFDLARTMTGRVKQYGIHASAYVVSDSDLRAELPAMMRTDDKEKKEKVLATQIEMRGVEEAGYPKLDLLAIRNLTTLALTLELAGIEENPNDVFWAIDADEIEEAVGYWEQIDRGHTLGFFQIEASGSARSIAKDLHPRSILDLSAAVALNRPGPDSKAYLDRRNNRTETKYPHKLLKPVLDETHGQFIYQEQVINLANMIGYDLSESDHVRKVLGKKLRKEMEELRPEFIAKMTAMFTEKVAISVWDSIDRFSAYAFNKAHSVGYGMLLAWTMWAKWKYPTEYIMALILTAKDLKKIGAFIEEGRRIGVNISGPDINESEIEITKKGDTIYYGLTDIKGVGLPASRWICENRPFDSKEHLLAKHQQHQLRWEQQYKGVKGLRPISPNMTLKSNQIEALWDAGAFDKIESRDIPDEEKAALEEALLGVVLTDLTGHIIRKNQREIDKLSLISELATGKKGDILPVAGVVKNVKMVKTKPTARKYPNADMAFVQIEWQGEDAEMVVFPEAWAKYKYMMERNSVCRLDLKVDTGTPIFEKGKRFV